MVRVDDDALPERFFRNSMVAVTKDRGWEETAANRLETRIALVCRIPGLKARRRSLGSSGKLLRGSPRPPPVWRWWADDDEAAAACSRAI